MCSMHSVIYFPMFCRLFLFNKGCPIILKIIPEYLAQPYRRWHQHQLQQQVVSDDPPQMSLISVAAEGEVPISTPTSATYSN